MSTLTHAGAAQDAPSYHIRGAQPADLDQVRRIYNHYVATSTVTFDLEPTSRRSWEEKLAKLSEARMPFLVAEAAPGEVLGYALVGPWRPRAAYRYTVENSIYLGEDAQGRGIGTGLMRSLIEACARAGVREIVAVIADHGADVSLRLHRSLGFAEIGHLQRVGFKFDRWLGTVLLQLSLPPAVPDGTLRAASRPAGRDAPVRPARAS